MQPDARDSIIFEEQDELAHVRLNRPEKRNALTSEMLEHLARIFAELSMRQSLRAVILSGEGEAFCAGTDIGELAELDEAGARLKVGLGQQVCHEIESCAVPVIGAIDGAAAGGGCELALACHLRVATSRAVFSLPETKLGVMPAYGGTQRMARVTGSGRALELMLADGRLKARDALNIGLVNRIVEPVQLLSEAEAVARQIATSAPLAVRACLEAVRRGQELPLAEGLKLEAELFSRLFATEDMREGTRAFLEKRPPVFKGR